MANTYYRGQGKVWIATRDSTGRTSGFTEVGDAEALTINQAETFDDVYESQSGARAKVVHSSIQLDVNFEMTILNFSGDNLKRALLGSNAAVAGASITNEAHKAYKGAAIFTKYPGISAVTVTNVAGSTTYVSGTDYTVDATTGRIDFLTGGSITNGDTVHVDYTHGAVDAVVESLVDTDNREYVIVFEGKNMNQQGTPVIVRCHRAYMNLAAALSLLGTATQRFQVTGSLLPAPEITTTGMSKFMNVTIKDLN